jgi:ketosteroid isomerase-like protein
MVKPHVAVPRLPLVALLFLLPCTSLAQSAAQAVGEVRSARLAQNAAIAVHALDSVATFWTTDVVIVSSRGAVMRGKDTYRQAFAGDSVMIYVRTPVRIEAASPWPLVWEEGTWVGQQGANGPTVIGGRYAAQWHRIDGRWLIRSELFVAVHCAGGPCRWPVQSPEPGVGRSR